MMDDGNRKETHSSWVAFRQSLLIFKGEDRVLLVSKVFGRSHRPLQHTFLCHRGRRDEKGMIGLGPCRMIAIA